MLDKGKFREYVRIISFLISNNDYKLTSEDRDIIKYMKDFISNNPEYSDINEKIIDLNGDEEKIDELIDSYTENKTDKIEKSEEEQISKAFNIGVEDIEHLYLNGGKKIFYFYSESLGRDVVLENTKNGKNLVDILDEIRTNNDDSYSSQDYLIQDSNINNIEMDMHSPEEIINNRNLIGSLNDGELNLLRYLIENANNLDIKSINIENLFYITNDHKIKEISYDMNYKPIIGGPENMGDVENENNTQEMTSDEQADLNDMFSDSENKNDINKQEDENTEDKNKENSNKMKVMKITNYSENGFANNYFFIFAAILIIIIFVIIYIVLGELI